MRKRIFVLAILLFIVSVVIVVILYVTKKNPDKGPGGPPGTSPPEVTDGPSGPSGPSGPEETEGPEEVFVPYQCDSGSTDGWEELSWYSYENIQRAATYPYLSTGESIIIHEDGYPDLSTTHFSYFCGGTALMIPFNPESPYPEIPGCPPLLAFECQKCASKCDYAHSCGTDGKGPECCMKMNPYTTDFEQIKVASHSGNLVLHVQDGLYGTCTSGSCCKHQGDYGLNDILDANGYPRMPYKGTSNSTDITNALVVSADRAPPNDSRRFPLEPITRRMIIERAVGWLVWGPNYAAGGGLIETCACIDPNNDSFRGEKFIADSCPSRDWSRQCCGLPGMAWRARSEHGYCATSGNVAYPIDVVDARQGDAVWYKNPTAYKDGRKNMKKGGLLGTKNFEHGGLYNGNSTMKSANSSLRPGHIMFLRHVTSNNHLRNGAGEIDFIGWQQGASAGRANVTNERIATDINHYCIMRRYKIVTDDMKEWEDDHYQANPIATPLSESTTPTLADFKAKGGVLSNENKIISWECNQYSLYMTGNKCETGTCKLNGELCTALDDEYASCGCAIP